MASTRNSKGNKKQNTTDKTPSLDEMIRSELDALIKKNSKFSDALDDATVNQLMKQIENKLVRGIGPDSAQVRAVFRKIKIKE